MGNFTLGLPDNLDCLDAYTANAGDFAHADLLRIHGKIGKAVHGIDDADFPVGDKVAVLIAQGQIGYIDWGDGQKDWLAITEAAQLPALRQRMGKLDPTRWTERDPRGNPRDPLQESVRLPMFWPAEGKFLVYATSSARQCRAVRGLVKDCVHRARIEPERASSVPVVTFGVAFDVHSNSAIGKIYYPVFEFTEWMPAPQVAHLSDLLTGRAPIAIGQHAPDIEDDLSDLDDILEAKPRHIEPHHNPVAHAPRAARRK